MVRRRVVPGLHHVRRSAQGQEPLSDGRQGRRATHEADQDGPRGQGLTAAPPGRARRLRVGDGRDGAAPRRLLLAARPLEGRGGRGDARRPGEAQGRALRHVLGFPPERPRRQRHGDDGIRRDVPQVAGRRRVAEPLVPGLLLRISRRRHGGVVGEVHRQRGGALGAAPQVHQLAAGAGRAPDVVQGRQLRLRRERRRRRDRTDAPPPQAERGQTRRHGELRLFERLRGAVRRGGARGRGDRRPRVVGAVVERGPLLFELAPRVVELLLELAFDDAELARRALRPPVEQRDGDENRATGDRDEEHVERVAKELPERLGGARVGPAAARRATFVLRWLLRVARKTNAVVDEELVVGVGALGDEHRVEGHGEASLVLHFRFDDLRVLQREGAVAVARPFV
mmetsp:Transcript_34732/g.107441  ORF Transcript_34732/g.107441 Transcript_34732/m.107441 type:complete len:398 (-) Transcript_34732:1017-2210(-)